ncbi:MAG TPA: TolC family protein [Caulobacteraceae bacterium]|jgi:NodT family efflux transporter outer membrane factor (OMF) lipoprotein
MKRLLTPVIIGASLAAAGLAGCAVGPNYEKPKAAGLDTGAFAAAGPAVAAAPATSQWWRLYNDPTLDRLVQGALVHNTDLQQAVANLGQARALLNQAHAGYFPSTAITAGDQYGRTAFADAAAAAQGKRAPDIWTFAAGLDVSYEVDLFGRVRRTVEQARAGAQAAEAVRDTVAITVAAETARAYADACAYGEALDVARRSLDVVQQGYDITVRQRDAGGLSDFDVARQATLLAQTRAEVPVAEGLRRSALFQLAVLTGQTPETLIAEADACRAPPRLNQPIPVGDGAAMLRRRPDVREAERNLAAATARIGVATAGLYPTITLGGALSSAASTLGGLGQYRNASFGVGPLISWTFPNTLVANAQIQQAKAAASGALANFNGQVLNALKETEQALSGYGTELDRHSALQTARDQSAEALRLAQVRFQAGGASFLDVLDAQRTLVSADATLAASDEAMVADQIALFKALGGGWEDAPATAPPSEKN